MSAGALSALSRYARAAQRGAPDAVPCCELCAVAIATEHPHVVDLEARQLRCVCRACGLLFTQPQAARGRYRAVPTRVRYDPDLVLRDADWHALGVPVRLAFVFYASPAARWLALYPSPAGPTEAELDQDVWAEWMRHALIRDIEPDVEALLVYGGRGEPLRAWVVPIDLCYALVGRVRRHWQGFDGGEARDEIAAFFGDLERRARPLRKPEGGHA